MAERNTSTTELEKPQLPDSRFKQFEGENLTGMLSGEIPSTPEDLSMLREYVIQLSMNAHANLSDPVTQEGLDQLGFKVVRKDEKLPPENRYIEIESTHTDGYPFIEFTHRFAPLSKDNHIEDPQNQDFTLSSASIDFHNLPSGFYLNAVNKESIFGEFYIGSDSRTNTVMQVARLPIAEEKALAFNRSISLLKSAATSPVALVKTIYQIVSESITDKEVLRTNMQDQIHLRIDQLHDALSNGQVIFNSKHTA